MKRLELAIFEGRKCELEVSFELGAYIGRPEACLIAQVSDSKLRRLIEDGCFPAPVLLSDGSHGFAVTEVAEWWQSCL